MTTENQRPLTVADIPNIVDALVSRLSGSNATDDIVDKSTACKIIKCSPRTLTTLLKEFPEMRLKGKRGKYVRKICQDIADFRKRGLI